MPDERKAAAVTSVVPLRVAYAPRVLFLVALGVICLGMVVRWNDVPDRLMIAGYLVWLLMESPVTFRRAVAVRDTRTLVPYALARIATVAPATLVESTMDQPLIQAVGATLFVGGIALRELAIRTLGRLYSHHVALRTEHPIVTGGPYRLIRHPAYAGMLLANIGFVAYFLNPASAAGMVALTVAVLWRIRVEEKVLWQLPVYRSYATGRARLIPGVW